MLRRTPFVSLFCLVAGNVATADTVTLAPSKDNTLYEDGSGALSNGAGMHMFVGQVLTDDSRRRAVLKFDVAGSIPAGSAINSVTLTMNMSRTISGATDVKLHRLLTDWGEGASAASGNEGAGAPSAPGDATWDHTFFPGSFWATKGGDFSATPSASTSVSGLGSYAWGSTGGMVADVVGWVSAPASNNGWIVIGDEGTGPTTKRFDTRENGVPTDRPSLVIDFTPGAGSVPTMSEWGLGGLALLLLLSGAWLLTTRRP